MNLNNYPLKNGKAQYFGASSMDSGWVGGHNNWAYSLGGKFQTSEQKLAMFGKIENIQEPDQIAMSRTSEGLQKIPNTIQQSNAPKGSMLEGIDVTETLDPILENPNNPLVNDEIRVQALVPQ